MWALTPESSMLCEYISYIVLSLTLDNRKMWAIIRESSMLCENISYIVLT